MSDHHSSFIPSGYLEFDLPGVSSILTHFDFTVRTVTAVPTNGSLTAIIDQFGNIVAQKSMNDIGIIQSTVTKKLD